MSRLAKPLPSLTTLMNLFRINPKQNGLIRLSDQQDLSGNQSVRVNNEMFNQANIIYALHNAKFARMVKFLDGDRENMHVSNLQCIDEFNEMQDDFLQDLIS